MPTPLSRARATCLSAILLAILHGSVIAANGAETRRQAVPADHARKMTEGLALFNRSVRSILVSRCLKCHGGEAEKQSEFDLATREKLLAGGATGKVLAPGNARTSRLLRLVTHEDEPHMPQNGPRLSPREIADLAAWIDCGAPYDGSLLPAAERSQSWTKRTIGKEARQFWSFRPLAIAPPPPLVDRSRGRNAIDAFVLKRLAEKRLGPESEIEPRKLVRRIYFDLLGLPPRPEEVASFLRDPSPRAYEALVDRLLASPHFGNRWARHWLDVARFAESHGFEHDYDRPTAYHYRDFVIRAFNADLPYDTFIRWQLAGDELAPNNPLAMTATGFLAAGVHSTQITKNEVEKQRYDELDDMLATTGSGILGLSIGCARCHDHKFDPIPQADYYRLLSAFTTTVRSEVDLPLGPKGSKPLKALIASEGLPPLRLHTQGEDFFAQTYFLRRGDTNQKEGIAQLGYLQILMPSPDAQNHWPAHRPPGARTSFRRTAMADWITDWHDGAGALAARVIVNRLWQHHFGRGLVETPNDFGARGERPSNPELLDWLARELIRHDWRLKPIHKLIVTSAVYRQGDRFDPDKAEIDPDNRLCWRHERRRLEAEVVRDALLACGNRLDERMYGPGTLDESQRRRSVYFTVKRSRLVPMMQVFDAPEALSSAGDRPSTTIAPQALLLMNNPNVRDCARSFARRLIRHLNESPSAAVREGYRIALAREPEPVELREGAAFLDRQRTSYVAAHQSEPGGRALLDFSQVLLCLNEFVYVE